MQQTLGNSDIAVGLAELDKLRPYKQSSVEKKIRIAFFGHDIHDAAVRRRANSFLSDGMEVEGFMMRRGSTADVAWRNIDLGETRDGAFVQRFQQIRRGAHVAAASGMLECADVIYARNLDMLACAFLAKRHLKLQTPVIYECLDVHRLLVRDDVVGAAMRRLEGELLKRCSALIVSSPAFVNQHFSQRYKSAIPYHLVENRMVAEMEYGVRPQHLKSHLAGPLRIGWFGVLRCQRSLNLLVGVASEFGEQVEINLRGRVSKVEIPNFESRIGKHPNINFGGEYQAPEDLASLYSSVDVVWAGDFMESGFNSVWLLPNRLYEGGYFAVPSIAPAGTETAKWMNLRSCGFEVAEPLHGNLRRLIRDLLADREIVTRKSQALLNLPLDTFVQPTGEMRDLIERSLRAEVN